MATINILPAHIANKIAAGEVVERPASVVKELVENAIDARATEITVILAQAGKELIQVIDNGVGMDEGDATLALERHATSKIREVGDLDRILTLGFRGEALPSIASVSRMEIKTCTQNCASGMQYQWEGGVLSEKLPIAMKHGTSISVKHLFFNTPARRNFLRADSTELHRINKWMKRFFLAHPDIRFTLIHNGEELYSLNPGSREERIGQVFGKSFLKDLLPVEEEMGDCRLTGFTSKPDKSRGNRDNQFLYLNRRAIINHNLAHAVAQGYGNLIEPGRHPQFVLVLEVDPEQVDINVHPTKMEVRFSNDRAMYSLFQSATREAVQTPSGTPDLSFKGEDQPLEIRLSFGGESAPANLPKSPEDYRPSRPSPATQMRMDYQLLPGNRSASHSPHGESEFESPAPSRHLPEPANLWQVHQRYLFSQMASGLVIVDQHRAHERILYEKFLTYLGKDNPVPSQQLLFPQTLELTLEDFLVFEEIRDWLRRVGFNITQLSGRTVVIEGIPSEVQQGRESRILLDIFDFYHENEGRRLKPEEKMAAAFANKNAVRPGEKLSTEAMSSLMDQLFATREPYFDPSGNPTIVTLEIEELDKKFKKR